MSEPIVYNETDFKENLWDFYRGMMYKGEPFTGTLLEPEWNSTTEFKGGNAHGRSIDYYDNGQLACDEIYENGEYISGKEWYRNGQIKFDSTGKSWYENGQLKYDRTGSEDLKWDRDGILVFRNNVWFYRNGQRVNQQFPDGTFLLFSQTGEVVLRKEKLGYEGYNPETRTYHQYQYYFYDNALRGATDELFTKLYPELGTTDDRVRSFFSWVGAVYSEDSIKGNLLIEQLMNHPDKFTQEHASFLKRLAQKKESGSKEITYWLEKSPFFTII